MTDSEWGTASWSKKTPSGDLVRRNDEEHFVVFYVEKEREE